MYWQTDSQNAARFVLKGSRKTLIQSDILKIKILERTYNILICPIWTPRTHRDLVTTANIGLKLNSSSDEFSLSSISYQFLCNYFKLFPTIDAMASDKNFKCKTFFSLIPQQHSSQVYYCCPPVTCVIPVLKKFLSVKHIKCIFLVPNWPAANFFPFLYPGKFLPQIQDYILFTPTFIPSPFPTLFNKNSHMFLGLKIVT